jgi:hypothetical protein
MHNSRIFFDYKGNCCANCGKSIQDAIERWGIACGFDLNHVNPETKATSYKNLMRRKKLSTEQLDEVDKCALVCKDCHTALHGQNLTVGLEIVLYFGDGVIFKRVLNACQVLNDKKQNRLMLFTDELSKIMFCKIFLDSKMVGYTTIYELGQNDLLVHLMMKTRECGNFALTTMEDQAILEVAKLDDTRFRLEYNPHFPLFKFDLQLTKDFGFHIRNGAMVTDQGVRIGGFSCSLVKLYEGLSPSAEG